jgi:hypothetical protein
MGSKLIGAALAAGVALMAGSAVAQADNWDGHRWYSNGNGWHGNKGWGHNRRPAYHYAPPPRVYYAPPPVYYAPPPPVYYAPPPPVYYAPAPAISLQFRL